MPKFMDVHHGMVGITAEALVSRRTPATWPSRPRRAWTSSTRGPIPRAGNVFCLSEAPSAEAIQRIHTRNGIPPAEIYPLPLEV